MIVGLNSDNSVKRLKGPDRPINSENDRKYLLQCLKFVDEVLIFDEDTPRRLIQTIKPDLIVKSSRAVPDEAEVTGYAMELFAHVDEYSTTNIINEILSNR